MSAQDDAIQIQSIMQHPGWKHIEAMLDAQVLEIKTEFYERVCSNPEQMIGKKGIRLGSRAKALEDFKESIYDRIKILNPTPKRGGS